MMIKRLFGDPNKTRPVVKIDEKTGATYTMNEPICTHVKVIETGVSREQNFSRRMVFAGLSEGWISLSPGTLMMKAEPEDLEYEVVREPGYYCVSSGERIPVSQLAWEIFLQSGVGTQSSQEAKAWLASHGKAANDYEITMAYECLLREDLHDKYKATTDAKGRTVAMHVAMAQLKAQGE